MVNGATIQPVIPSPADKVQSSNSKPGDTTFQEMLNKTADQKTEETNGENEKDDRQQSTPITDALEQLFFHPEQTLLTPDLPKVNEAGLAVVINEVTEEALVPETGNKDANAADPKGETTNVFAGEIKDAAGTRNDVLTEGMTLSAVKEDSVIKDSATETVQDEGKTKTVNDETYRTGKAEETATVNTGKNTVESDKATKSLETKVEDIAGKVETGMQNNTEAMAYVKQPAQQVSRPEPTMTQTVTVNPEKPQEMMKDISDSMIKNISSGKQEFELQLEPLNLGKLSIKVTYEAGKTAVSIICNSAKTLEAMSQNAREIGNMLEARLGAETAIIVDHPQSDYLEQYNQQKQDSQQQQKEQPQRQNNRKDTEQVDFLQQLRLGLI